MGKLSGSSGPKLKCLAQWLIENPMFEVDPKWAEEVRYKEPEGRKKGPGRPPLDDTPSSKSHKISSPGVGPSYNSMASLGIDPKKLNALAQPAAAQKAGGDPKAKSNANSTLDPMLLAAFGMDPKNPKLDPITAAALGLDPKNPKFDPMVLASLGLDPKNPNSTILAAMAAMDPNHQLAAMYGMMPPGYPGMPGMDMFGKGAKTPAKDTKSPHPAPSPRGSSQRDGPSPRPPSRASASSRDGRENKDGRSTPSRSSAGATSMSQASPRPQSNSQSAASMAGMFGGMNPALFGLDPKMLASMDPKLLQAAGIDPKMPSSLVPKMLGMMDPRMAASMGGMDLKALSQMDPKLLQAAGIDPNLLSKMLDPKALAGMDAKMLASMGMDPKMLASMGIDPKSAGMAGMGGMGGMDAKLLASMGLDP